MMISSPQILLIKKKIRNLDTKHLGLEQAILCFHSLKCHHFLKQNGHHRYK